MWDGVTFTISTYDTDTIHAVKEPILSLLDFVHNHLIEPLTAVLLHTLEAKAYIDGQVEAEALVRLEDVEPAHDRAFVVRRTPADEPATLLVYDELEWISLPSV